MNDVEHASIPPPETRARRMGRRVAQVVYWAAVVFIVVAATLQVTTQVFFAAPADGTATFTGCEEGLWALLDSIEEAKHAAESPEGDVHEEAALNRFRSAITPTWEHRDRVAALCAGTGHERLLDAIERLRYSEEHGVRHQAAELTALRRHVSNLVASELKDRPRRGKTP